MAHHLRTHRCPFVHLHAQHGGCCCEQDQAVLSLTPAASMSVLNAHHHLNTCQATPATRSQGKVHLLRALALHMRRLAVAINSLSGTPFQPVGDGSLCHTGESGARN